MFIFLTINVYKLSYKDRCNSLYEYIGLHHLTWQAGTIWDSITTGSTTGEGLSLKENNEVSDGGGEHGC